MFLRLLAAGLRWAAPPAAALLLVWACLWVTDRGLWQHDPVGGLPVYPTRLVLLGLAAAALLAGFAAALRARPSRWILRSWAAALGALLALLGLEIVFMFVPQSHNVGYTLAARIWYDRYWGPENTLGYRDAEPVRQPGRTLVCVVGDSFTAGAGLAAGRRFADVLAALRPDLQVVNVGRCGADSGDEFERLQRFPLRPDLVVLQYYPNDIDGAAAGAGHHLPSFAAYEDLRSVKLRFLVRGSFLANFVYWQFPHADGAAYERFLGECFRDPAVLSRHHADLARFAAWSRAQGVPLRVVMFPLLEDLEWSRRCLAPVRQWFVDEGVPVLDVGELIGDLPGEARLVNHHDGHASVEVHRRVGEAMAGWLPR